MGKNNFPWIASHLRQTNPIEHSRPGHRRVLVTPGPASKPPHLLGTSDCAIAVPRKDKAAIVRRTKIFAFFMIILQRFAYRPTGSSQPFFGSALPHRCRLVRGVSQTGNWPHLREKARAPGTFHAT